jgi:tRNA pseudouridine55 synthase
MGNRDEITTPLPTPHSPLPNSGLLLLNKKPGITSFDALRDIKRALGTGKVGHTGTLDKFASGLLVVLAGRALKLSQWFTGCDKEYSGRICFGTETDTLDPEGEVVANAPLPSREAVEAALLKFTGEIMQAPPAYSAIHINGKRASSLARSGQAPQMKERSVTVKKIELRGWEPPFADIYVCCSSGTYIRSLARDIALASGSRAHLCSLTRTKVADFSLDDAAIPPLPTPYSPLPINKTVISKLNMPFIDVSPQEAQNFKHGKPLEAVLKRAPQQGEQSAAVFCDEELIAVVENSGGKWKYGCVLGQS